MKKSFIIFALVIFCVVAVFGKEYILTVHKSDNTTEIFALENVDSLTFIEKGESGIENGHVWIDLGLPSGTLWSICNVGAAAPEEYGYHFAWGETEPKEEGTPYNWANYKWGIYDEGNKPTNGLTKYNGEDGKTTLDLEDDAAHVQWGGAWRMPTIEEQTELLNNCTWTWTKRNGVNGYEVMSKNGNSIFFPAAGNRYNSYNRNVNSHCLFWSSSRYSNKEAHYFSLSSSKYETYYVSRYYGYSVRAVCKP